MNELPLRPNVCMLVYNRDGKLFLGERMGESGLWQFPQGGLEAGSSLEENVLRELEEELGAPGEAFRLIVKLKAVHCYVFEDPPEYARGKWRGQNQCFYLVEYVGEDCQIDVSRYEPEFMNWRWCTVSEVRSMAEPRRLPGYAAPLGEFEEYLEHIRK